MSLFIVQYKKKSSDSKVLLNFYTSNIFLYVILSNSWIITQILEGILKNTIIPYKEFLQTFLRLQTNELSVKIIIGSTCGGLKDYSSTLYNKCLLNKTLNAYHTYEHIMNPK